MPQKSVKSLLFSWLITFFFLFSTTAYAYSDVNDLHEENLYHLAKFGSSVVGARKFKKPTGFWMTTKSITAVEQQDVNDVMHELRDAIDRKDHIKVIGLLHAMVADCTAALSSERNTFLANDCRWAHLIDRASQWIGRKLKNELDEFEPDFADVANKLEWLKEYDAFHLLNVTNPLLIRQANHMLTELSSRAVLTATDKAQHNSHKKPPADVFFVLSLPGAGKTTATKNAEKETGCKAISIGEVGRRACNDDVPTQFCRSMQKSRMQGMAENPSVSVKLLEKELKQRMKYNHETCFLIDGFPRSLTHLAEWVDEKMPEKFWVRGLIVLDIPPKVAEKRVLGRGDSDRSVEDNPIVFQERVKYYSDHTQPVIDTFLNIDASKVVTVDATQKPDIVSSAFTAALDALSTTTVTSSRRVKRGNKEL